MTQTKRIFGKFRIVFTGQIGELLAVIKDAYILPNYCHYSKAKSNRFLPPFPSLYLKIYMVEICIEGWSLICDKIYIVNQ